jgi:4-hydroxybenzoate polyprenyltransferase
MILPVTCIGVFGAILGGYSDSSEPLWTAVARTPQTFIWVWCNVLLFSISNQRSQEAILEDSINKPWRPLPSGTITSAQAKLFLLFGIPALVVICHTFLGAAQETVICLLLTWMYNDLGGADNHFLLKNGINSLAYFFYGCGSIRVASGTGMNDFNIQAQDPAVVWLGIISGLIFTTMQIQDLKDQEGDRAAGRSTLPLDLGDNFCRWTVAVGVLVWSFIVSRYWCLNLAESTLPFFLGITVACRLFSWSGPSADSQTYKSWSIWLISVFSLPLLRPVRLWITYQLLNQSNTVLAKRTRIFLSLLLSFLDTNILQILHQVGDRFWFANFRLYLVLTVSTYLVLVRLLRYRQRSYHLRLAKEQKCSKPQSMPIKVAQNIYVSLFDVEFPFMFMKGIQLALFRTYAIPTISSLLMEKGSLASPAKIARRYSETEVLFLEFALREWGSTPWLEATARTRAIHATWRKTGLANEEDMLYTLAVLATQPVELVQKWEWRSLTSVELCAVGTLYRGIADAMGIDHAAILGRSSPNMTFQAFIGFKLCKSEHDDSTETLEGLDFFNRLQAWQSSYELRVMTYTDHAHRLAEIATDFLLWGIPGKRLKSFGVLALTSLMDPPLRSAVGFDVPFAVECITTSLMRLRQLLLRHLCLSRMFRVRRITDRVATREYRGRSCLQLDASSSKSTSSTDCKPTEVCATFYRSIPQQRKGKSLMLHYTGAPYFVAPTVWNRWGLGAWWWWLLGLPLPGDKTNGHDTYESGGYDLTLLGPEIGKSTERQKREESAVEAVARTNRWI